MLPAGHGVIEIGDRSHPQSPSRSCPVMVSGALATEIGLRNRGGGKGGGVFRSGGGKGYRSTPTNDGTGSVDLDDVTIAGGVV